LSGARAANSSAEAGGGAEIGGGAETGGGVSEFALSVRCGGRLYFKEAEIPSLLDEEVFTLVQDSFYDGAFEKLFNEFFANLIRFASANRQLLGIYGFPGF
jgi:hypothetical protein